MKKAKRKIYFYATELENKETWRRSLVFSGQNWMRAHWAWGNEDRVNFVLEKLIQTYGKEEWVSIYTKFNQALIDITHDKKPETWEFPKASLVLMEKIDDSKISSVKWDMTKTNEGIHPSK